MVLITQHGEPILSRLTVKAGAITLAADHRQKNTVQTPASFSSPKPFPPAAFYPVSQLIKNPSIPLILLPRRVSSQSQLRETLCSSPHAKVYIHTTLGTQQHQPLDAKCPPEAPRQKSVLLHECFCNAASGQRWQHRAALTPLAEREKELLQLSHVAAQTLKVTSTHFTHGNQPACYAKCSLTVFNCPLCWSRGGFFSPDTTCKYQEKSGVWCLAQQHFNTGIKPSVLLYSWHVNSHSGCYQRVDLGCRCIYDRKSDALE